MVYIVNHTIRVRLRHFSQAPNAEQVESLCAGETLAVGWVESETFLRHCLTAEIEEIQNESGLADGA